MGTHVYEDDPVLGDPCGNFDPTDETPLRIYVIFANLVQCPAGGYDPPNDHQFTLTQTDGNPCIWEGAFPAFGFIVRLNLSSLSPGYLEIVGELGRRYFYGTITASPPEHHIFVNSFFVCKPDQGAKLGYGIIFWKKAAVALIEALGLWSTPKILMEFFVTDEGVPIYKFCTTDRSYNIKVLLTP